MRNLSDMLKFWIWLVGAILLFAMTIPFFNLEVITFNMIITMMCMVTVCFSVITLFVWWEGKK